MPLIKIYQCVGQYGLQISSKQVGRYNVSKFNILDKVFYMKKSCNSRYNFFLAFEWTNEGITNEMFVSII